MTVQKTTYERVIESIQAGGEMTRGNVCLSIPDINSHTIGSAITKLRKIGKLIARPDPDGIHAMHLLYRLATEEELIEYNRPPPPLPLPKFATTAWTAEALSGLAGFGVMSNE